MTSIYGFDGYSDGGDADEDKKPVVLSRRKLRLAAQPSIVELKASIDKPDLVEWEDVTARDPFLLVKLKTYRNTVAVPPHWKAKRKYLVGKRGFVRPPFELPDFIKRTGIMDLRGSAHEHTEQQSLKGKMRERSRPKVGRTDIDYQKLHDAFFKWQSKPKLTRMGDLYYEGKELQGDNANKRPGVLSDELKMALGMPIGPVSNKFPPPWLVSMQRYGPPPSYPGLKIPGLNSPIPQGCTYGYHAGGWGKPPVDQYNRPIYGDVFGMHSINLGEDDQEDEQLRMQEGHWGELEDEDVAEMWSAAGSDIEEEEDEVGEGEGEGVGGAEQSEAGAGLGADIDRDADTITTIDDMEEDDEQLIPLQKNVKRRGNDNDSE